MDVFTALAYIILGGILGMVGQGVRVIVGLKKQLDHATGEMNTWFSWKKLALSLIIAMIVGGIAGVLGVIGLFGQEITKEFIMTVLGAGYAGTDFIEGFIKKHVPIPTQSEPVKKDGYSGPGYPRPMRPR